MTIELPNVKMTEGCSLNLPGEMWMGVCEVGEERC